MTSQWKDPYWPTSGMQCRKGFERWSCGSSFWWIWTSYMPNTSKSLGEPASSLQQVWLELWRRGTCLLHSYPQWCLHNNFDRGREIFSVEHVGALSLDFHLQIWPGTLSTDELRRALCGVGLKTADAPQRNGARKQGKTWKHDESCGLTAVWRVVWQCIWALDSCGVNLLSRIVSSCAGDQDLQGHGDWAWVLCSQSWSFYKRNRRLLDLSDCILHGIVQGWPPLQNRNMHATGSFDSCYKCI